MTSLESLAIAAVVSIFLSAALCAVIFRPLQALLAKVCSGEEAVRFWGRFSVVMLFLSPLLVSIVFGLPSAELTVTQNAGALLQQIIATALFGAFLSMLGMGLWVSALIRRAPRPATPAVRRDGESWAGRVEP